MNVNYRVQNFKNNFTPNRKENRNPTFPLYESEPRTNNIFLNLKNNGRNNNIISLHKTPKNNTNFFLQNFNSNNNNIYKRNKLLISTDIKQDDNKKISFSNFETRLNYKENNSYNNTTLNNININSQSETFFQNKKNNVMLTDSNDKKNIINQKMVFNSMFTPFKDSYQQLPKNDNNLTEVKKRRFSVMDLRKTNFDLRKTITNTNNKNINQRRKSIFNPRNSNASSTFKTMNNAPRRYSISFVTNPDLRERITELLKEMSLHHRKEIEKYERGEDSIFNGKKAKKKKPKNKSIDFMAKKNRNKFLTLFNKDGSFNSFLKLMKYKSINNILKNVANRENNIIKRPKNTIEMNKLLISSFALTQDRAQELSKKLYLINENFFKVMKEMKIGKAEMELKQLSQKKDKITPLTVELIKSNGKKWERKFLLKQYDDKMSEKEFKKFKKLNKIERKEDIKKKSKQLADNIMKMDAREYEKPDDIYIFKSTGGYVSKINIHRIRRVKKILENIEDNEQLGAIDVNVEKLRKNQKKSEAEVLLAIKRSGKPRFVKTHFKESTIIKYKGASGEYFGVPA